MKESHVNNSEQVKLFGDLRNILIMKLRATRDDYGAGNLRGRDLGGEGGVGGVNRLVIND